MFLISFILYLYISAKYYERFTKKIIIKKNDISITLIDNELKSGKLIGKTKKVIFLLKNENVYAIPITSLVKEIKIK